MFAVSQLSPVDVNEILVRPTAQEGQRRPQARERVATSAITLSPSFSTCRRLSRLTVRPRLRSVRSIEAVAIELGGGVVIAVAVGLDHQPVCAPKKVGPPTMKLHVHLGDLEPTRLAKRDEDSLSPAPRVRQARLMALERLAEGPGATLSVTKHAFDRLDVEDVEVFGLRERLSRLVQPGVCREVNQRLGDGGNRETAVAGGVEVTGVVDENFGQRARPTEGADSIRHGWSSISPHHHAAVRWLRTASGPVYSNAATSWPSIGIDGWPKAYTPGCRS